VWVRLKQTRKQVECAEIGTEFTGQQDKQFALLYFAYDET
jgi:hypothetical protein